MNIYFDVETTGLPPKYGNIETDFPKYPHIVQMSWKRSDEGFVSDYILNNGVEIPKESTDIHVVTTGMADESPHCFTEVVVDLIHDAFEAEYIIAHNGYFDISMTFANMLRFINDKFYIEKFKLAFSKEKRKDTMLLSTKYCAIPHQNNRGFKWPKLEELYHKLFNDTFPAHNSKEDVLATERCFNELIKLKIIIL